MQSCIKRWACYFPVVVPQFFLQSNFLSFFLEQQTHRIVLLVDKPKVFSLKIFSVENLTLSLSLSFLYLSFSVLLSLDSNFPQRLSLLPPFSYTVLLSPCSLSLFFLSLSFSWLEESLCSSSGSSRHGNCLDKLDRVSRLDVVGKTTTTTTSSF